MGTILVNEKWVQNKGVQKNWVQFCIKVLKKGVKMSAGTLHKLHSFFDASFFYTMKNALFFQKLHSFSLLFINSVLKMRSFYYVALIFSAPFHYLYI